MPADQAFHDEMLALLMPIGGVSSRAMFGGFGVFHDGAMFALISEASLYFKVDDATRPAYEAAGSERFGRMPYHLVPADVIEDERALNEWALAAIGVAHTAPTRRRR